MSPSIPADTRAISREIKVVAFDCNPTGAICGQREGCRFSRFVRLSFSSCRRAEAYHITMDYSQALSLCAVIDLPITSALQVLQALLEHILLNYHKKSVYDDLLKNEFSRYFVNTR